MSMPTKIRYKGAVYVKALTVRDDFIVWWDKIDKTERAYTLALADYETWNTSKKYRALVNKSVHDLPKDVFEKVLTMFGIDIFPYEKAWLTKAKKLVKNLGTHLKIKVEDGV